MLNWADGRRAREDAALLTVKSRQLDLVGEDSAQTPGNPWGLERCRETTVYCPKHFLQETTKPLGPKQRDQRISGLGLLQALFSAVTVVNRHKLLGFTGYATLEP